MVREFYLVNEKNEKFSLMDIYNNCLLTEPNGLGYLYDSTYEQLGNSFVEDIRTLGQGQIIGQVNLLNYELFQKFIQFVETAEVLRFLYRIPLKDGNIEYLKDVNIASLSKTEKGRNGIISEKVTFDCLSLWYQNEEITYTVGDQDMMWDFMWDARFADYKSRSIVVENDGHVDAPMQIEIADYTKNPTIYVMHKNKEVFNLSLPIIIQNGEKLLYSSKEKEIYIKKQNRDGTYENLFKYPYIDLNNRNIFRLPKGTCEITLTAENNIVNSKLNIFKQYKVV